MKAECWWCGCPSTIAKHGMIYLHPACFNEIVDAADDIEVAVEYAKGLRPKVKKNDDVVGYASLVQYLVEMQSFRHKFAKVVEQMKILEQKGVSEKLKGLM